MGKLGFFTRVEVKSGLIGTSSKMARKAMPIELLHQLGEKAVADMNRGAKHPNMEPTGAKKPVIYMLGEAPGETEDRTGQQFVGKSGEYLRSKIPEEWNKRIRWNNTVRTRPPRNRKPLEKEVEAFRPSVEKDIATSKPMAIVAVGGVAMSWCLPGMKKAADKINVCRGRRFPIIIAGHKCWVYPVLHPSYILRVREQDKVGAISGKDIEKLFIDDMKRVFDDAANDRLSVAGTPLLGSDPDEIEQRCFKLVTPSKGGLRAIEKGLAVMATQACVAIDIETNGLRPYTKDAKILTIAVGTGSKVLAFPVLHPEANWSQQDLKSLRSVFREFILNSGRKVMHNAAFDLEWLVHWLGEDIAWGTEWDCSQIKAFILDERRGGHSLDFLCRLYFGVPLKKLSNVDTSNLESLDLYRVQKYNALDVKFTYELSKQQDVELEAANLTKVYRRFVKRVRSAVLTQRKGMPVSKKRVEYFQDKFASELDAIKKAIFARMEVTKFKKKIGHTFSPTSVPDLVIMFRDILHRKEGQKAQTYSTDEGVLSTMKGCPMAELVLELRGIAKLKSTYVDRMHPDARDSLVYPDGLLHPRFIPDEAETGRFASRDPNAQNFPKRKHPEVRRIIKAPKGMLILASDYGQIEARVIGMASRDKAFCKALRTNYDVHMEWAEKVAKAWPRTFKARGSDMKKFRSDIKNQMVFPAFYGASAGKISRLLALPEHVAQRLLREFWDQFHGVKRWQRDVLHFYAENGYVECLTGRRRHGPLSYNMVLNTPIQGTASDIVVDAMNKLSRMSVTKKDTHLQPFLNVHDDLSFIVPEKNLDYYVKVISKTMLKVDYPWVNVPVTIEMACGRDWFDMKNIGVFSTADR